MPKETKEVNPEESIEMLEEAVHDFELRAHYVLPPDLLLGIGKMLERRARKESKRGKRKAV